MLIEQCAYSNRWRRVSPAAKSLFCLCALTAALLAANPWLLLAAAFCIAMLTIAGAGVRTSHYLKLLLPPLFFLASGTVPLMLSLHPGNALFITWTPDQFPRVLLLASRSTCSLTALLLLALTTPMTDIVALLRRWKMPDVLLDIITLTYRTLFVFSESIHETRTAQASRLGYASNRAAFRSLGALVTNLSFQIWRRSLALHHAALARGNNGPLLFLETPRCDGAVPLAGAAAAGLTLIILAVLL